MREITHITIRKDCERSRRPYTVFLEYNGNSNDYSFNPFETFNAALQSLPLDSSYFPLKTDSYELMVIEGNKTHFRETIKL